MQPIAGYNFGAQKPERVNEVLRKAILYATITMCCSFILCEFFPHYPIMMFTDDPELSAITTRGMKIIVLMSPVVGFQIVTANFFQSIGMVKKSIFISVSRQLVFLCPFLLTFPNYWGTDGVWASITTADGISTLMTAFMLWQFYYNKDKMRMPRIRMKSTLLRTFFHNRLTP